MMTAAWLVLGCGGGGQYNQVLDRAQKQNQNREPITGIDSIQMAAEYLDRHGSANEQVRAHYLLGCAYRDAGDALKALEAYHDAADCADTTRDDCDYGLLIRVHGQASDLFKRQLLSDEMLTELEVQRRYALRIGDMRVAINALERSADAYYMMARKDSIIPILRRASAQYEQFGFPEEAAQSLGPCIEPLVDRGDTAAARRCIERYESSRQFFRDGELLPSKAVHYYNKGKYCLAVGKTDSAEVYFRKLLRSDLAPGQLEAGYHGLFLLYKQQRGPADSIAKYGDLQYDQNNLVMAATNAERVQQMQAMYNYAHYQQSEEQMRAQVQIRGWIIAVIVSVFVICLMIGFGLWKRQQWLRRQQQLEYDALFNEYEKEKAQLALAKSSVGPTELRLHQERIEELERKLDQLMKADTAKKSAPVNFGTDTPLSALFREEYHGELRTVIESWRPSLTDDDPAVDALAMYQFHFDFKKIMATAVYIDLGRLLSVHALADENISTLSWYLFNHSNLSTSQPTLYAQLRKYKKR